MAEPRDEQWYVDTKRRIREAFQLFDKDRKGCVVQEEVATIMRYLGSYPTERAMVKAAYNSISTGLSTENPRAPPMTDFATGRIGNA